MTEVSFAERIVRWYETHGRDFPWRRISDPYAILVAEVLLHHTDAAKVAEVFDEFLGLFPTPDALAAASRHRVRRLIRGLGKHHRADDLVALARELTKSHAGEFPLNANVLMRLEGIGRYTAHAVLCFAAGLPVPLLDTNILRVLSRHFDWKIDTEKSRKDPKLWDAAASLVPPNEAKAYHWGLIDLGATVCRPRNPRCPVCPVNATCVWRSRRALNADLKSI